MTNEKIYRPQLSALIERADDDWKQYNPADIIYYKIAVIDDALYGIDIQRGELIGIQAPEKNRKTTFIFNILFNISRQFKQRNIDKWICFDTLESGMLPSACRDQLIAMSATRHMIGQTFNKTDFQEFPTIEEIRHTLGDQLTISKDFLRFGEPTLFQQQAIQKAKVGLMQFPLSIFGPSFDEGNTRNLNETFDRWEKLYHGQHPTALGQQYRIFVSDNVQLYAGFFGDRYSQLEEVVERQANFMVTHPGSVVISVSQMGKGSLSDRRKGGEAYAKGGGALAAEATVLFETEYDKDNQPDNMLIKVPRTRKKPPPIVVQPIDRESGAFIGKAYALRS